MGFSSAIPDRNRNPVRHLHLAQALLLALFLPTPSSSAQDIITLVNGARQPGRVISVDATTIRIQATTIPGQSPATVALPRSQIRSVAFGETPVLLDLAGNPKGRAVELLRLWNERQSLLSLPESAVGALGLAVGEDMLRSPDPARKSAALAHFERLAKEDWDPARRALAAQGRLRALIAVGRAAEAVAAARKIAEETSDPTILTEAKQVLGEASLAEFKRFLEENPRWEDDPLVRPERHRLYHATLDLFLFGHLFGGGSPAAARGLWGAIQTYRLAGDLASARETARDIEVLYPGTPQATFAAEFVASLPDSIRKLDHEKQDH